MSPKRIPIILLLLFVGIVGFFWYPKTGQVLYKKTGEPVPDLKILVEHFRSYHWSLPMRNRGAVCLNAYFIKTDEDGEFQLKWIPLRKRELLDPSSRLMYFFHAYIPLQFPEDGGLPEVMYEFEAHERDYGYFIPDQYVIEQPFDVRKRMDFLEDIYSLSATNGCNSNTHNYKKFEKQWHAILRPEAEKMYPLWLQYLEENPFEAENFGRGMHGMDKFYLKLFFITVLGDHVRPEANRAGFPKATEKCDKFYRGLTKPKGIELSSAACFGMTEEEYKAAQNTPLTAN